jgi:hypothetical protein
MDDEGAGKDCEFVRYRSRRVRIVMNELVGLWKKEQCSREKSLSRALSNHHLHVTESNPPSTKSDHVGQIFQAAAISW